MSKADKLIIQLTRIADALEQRTTTRSWAAIYGSAVEHITQEKLAHEYEKTLDAHTVFLTEMQRQFGESPSVFEVTSKYTPQLLMNIIAAYLPKDDAFRTTGPEDCRRVALHLVHALQLAGLWGQ